MGDASSFILAGYERKKAVIEKICERDEDVNRPTSVSQMYFEPADSPPQFHV